ncbi:sensor histidine kinase [Sphingobacterium sp. JUb56]|uniref:tetratricopeptide repeat-containing sensor histidine kinase n=1 Tax=Sphingobacterium sp. JUb56 TaxID=2587145 RepID=UPI001613396E|nr:sensor histidine kinase [Sphingobacterium sp. JUb56]MBB2949848.1 signal transduction histidine kinase [Sphingobacterium sp. JUb56]
MLKRYFLSIIFSIFIFAYYAKAQQLIPLDEEAYVRQINDQINRGNSDSTRLYNYLLLSEYWAPTDALKSKQALDAVLHAKNKNILSSGLLNYYQAVYETSQGDKTKAKQLYNDAISILEKESKNKGTLIKSWYNYAYMQMEDKGYDFLVKTLTEKCIPLSEKSGNTELLAYCYTQLGLTFMSVGQLNTAEEYQKKALEQLLSIPEQNTAHLITYLNLVSNYCYKPDSKTAKIYLDKATALIKKYPNTQHAANYYYQVAIYHTTKLEFTPALENLSKGIPLAKIKKQGKMLQMLKFRMYNVYLMQKDYTKAKALMEGILDEDILTKEGINRKIIITQLATVNELMGDYKQAYQWLKKSSALSDSLQQKKLLEKMNALEISHQTSVKQQTINRLEQEKKENELLARNKNLRTILLGIALGLSLVIAFLAYLNYSKQRKLNEQISLSHQQQLLRIENKRKYDATHALLQGEEQERQRIAQDLHDSMGGMLANIRMSISKDGIGNINETNDIVQKLDRSISEMRRISRNLMPETLKNLGLETALSELCESMSYKKLRIQFEAFDLSENIPFETQLALYRITQESISNVIKYAQANNVIVQISQNDDLLNLTIEDDGVGFDKNQITKGLGLKNIENRVQLINGTVDITSAKGEGTTINVECYV